MNVTRFILENYTKDNFVMLVTRDLIPVLVEFTLLVRDKDLTNNERRILEVLMDGNTKSHEEIINEVWGYAEDDNILKVNISNLRRKGIPIETIKGKGYKLSKNSN